MSGILFRGFLEPVVVENAAVIRVAEIKADDPTDTVKPGTTNKMVVDFYVRLVFEGWVEISGGVLHAL